MFTDDSPRFDMVLLSVISADLSKAVERRVGQPPQERGIPINLSERTALKSWSEIDKCFVSTELRQCFSITAAFDIDIILLLQVQWMKGIVHSVDLCSLRQWVSTLDSGVLLNAKPTSTL